MATTSPVLSRLDGFDRPRLRRVFVGALAVLATWWLTRHILAGQTLLVVGVVGIGIFALALARPRAVAWLVVLMNATVLPQRAGTFSIGGIRTDGQELVLLLLLAAVVLRRAISREPLRWSRFSAPAVFIFGAAMLSGAVGYARGASWGGVLGDVKGYLFYLVIPAFAALWSDEEARARVERGILVVATIFSVLILVGPPLGIHVATVGSRSHVYTLGEVSDIRRILPALAELLVVAVLLVVSRLARRASARDAGLLALFVVVLGYTFTRSTWVPLLLMMVLYLVLRRPTSGTHRTLAVLVGLALAGGAVFVAASAGSFGARGTAIAERLSSATSTKVLDESSYQYRVDSDRAAWAQITADPVFGYALGRPYQVVHSVGLQTQTRSEEYIDNTYLGAWLFLGLAGVVGLLWFGYRAFRSTVEAHRESTVDADRAFASGCALAAFALAALLQTSLVNRPTIVSVALAVVLLDRGHGVLAKTVSMRSATASQENVVLTSSAAAAQRS